MKRPPIGGVVTLILIDSLQDGSNVKYIYKGRLEMKKESKELLYRLVNMIGKVLDLDLEENHNEEEVYENFDEVYAYIGYNLEISESTLVKLGIEGTSDLIDFYKEGF